MTYIIRDVTFLPQLVHQKNEIKFHTFSLRRDGNVVMWNCANNGAFNGDGNERESQCDERQDGPAQHRVRCRHADRSRDPEGTRRGRIHNRRAIAHEGVGRSRTQGRSLDRCGDCGRAGEMGNLISSRRARPARPGESESQARRSNRSVVGRRENRIGANGCARDHIGQIEACVTNHCSDNERAASVARFFVTIPIACARKYHTTRLFATTTTMRQLAPLSCRTIRTGPARAGGVGRSAAGGLYSSLLPLVCRSGMFPSWISKWLLLCGLDRPSVPHARYGHSGDSSRAAATALCSGLTQFRCHDSFGRATRSYGGAMRLTNPARSDGGTTGARSTFEVTSLLPTLIGVRL